MVRGAREGRAGLVAAPVGWAAPSVAGGQVAACGQRKTGVLDPAWCMVRPRPSRTATGSSACKHDINDVVATPFIHMHAKW